MANILITEFPQNSFELVKLKNVLLSQQEFISVIEITNCPTTLDASKLISNSIFRSILELLNNFTILKLKVDEKLNEKHAEKPKIHEFSIKRNFIISYESTKNENEKIIHWKNGNSGSYLTLNLIDGFSAKMTDFVRDFLIEAVNFEVKNANHHHLELFDLIDSTGVNLLMRAVDNEESAALIEELLLHPFDINQKTDGDRTIADIAWEKRIFEVLLILLEANSMYPKDFDEDELGDDEFSEKLREFLSITEEMHAAIYTKNYRQITDIIKMKTNLRYFYNSSNVSAAKVAINAKKHLVYDLLINNDCSIGPNENLPHIIDDSQTDELRSKIMKIKLGDIHTQASKPLPQKHLNILIANSVICHDNKFIKVYWRHINEVFKILNDIPQIKIILQIVATHKNFKIHFDFNRSSVEYLNPLSSSDTRGYCEAIGLKKVQLLVGVKGLLNENEKDDVVGSIAHELTHFAMSLIFYNEGKPYLVGDKENEIKFNKIIQKYQKLNYNEDIVSSVFMYENKSWVAELIVRVPQMIARYCNEATKLNEVKMTFQDLFAYFNETVMQKMTETLPKLEKFFCATSYKYTDLTDAYKGCIYNTSVIFQGSNVDFNQIIKNLEIFQHLTSEQIREILIDGKSSIKIGKSQEIDEDFYVERNFTDSAMKRIYNFDQIKIEAYRTKMILLSDHAGAGKTTTFKHLALKLKEHKPNYWISYIDLKRHIKIYEKFNGFLQKDRSMKMLIEILDITDDFEIELFTELFNRSKIILLFDGIDEIAPMYKDFIMRFIGSIRNATENQQWIATRPQHSQEMSLKFKEKLYNLAPYDDYLKLEFISKVIKHLNVHDYGDVIAKKILTIIDTKISLNSKIDAPLMLQKITEIYVKDQEIVNLSNKYLLYEKIIEMKKEIFSDKGKIVVSDCDNHKTDLTIWQVHQIYSIILLYPKSSYQEFSLFKRWKKQRSNWTPEAISRYGFLIVDHWNTYDEFPDFVHRTFAEFFVAQFIISDLYELVEDNDSNEQEITSKLKFLSLTGLHNVLDFIANFPLQKQKLKLNEKLFKSLLSEKMQKYLSLSEINNATTMLIKIFSKDERFLKEFRYGNNQNLVFSQTIFQQCLENHSKIDSFFEIFDIYENALGSDWRKYTGYEMKENLNDDQILKDFIASNGHENERALKIFKTLCIIEMSKISPTKVKKIFKINMLEFFEHSLNNRLMIEKFSDILKNNLTAYSESILRDLIQNYRRFKYSKDNNLQNLNYFVNQIGLDDTNLRLSLFTIFCGPEILPLLYGKYKFCTQNDVQNFFINNVNLITNEIINQFSSCNYDLGYLKKFFKKIFFMYPDEEKLTELLRRRDESSRDEFDNHSASISNMVSININLEKNKEQFSNFQKKFKSEYFKHGFDKYARIYKNQYSLQNILRTLKEIAKQNHIVDDIDDIVDNLQII